MEQEYTIDNAYLSPEAKKRKKDLEENPASRTNHMEYMDGMEVLDSDIKDKVRAAMQAYDYNAYIDADVRTALANAKQGHCEIEDFKALLSPAALPHLEEMAALAQRERLAHFGDCVNIFTPLYIANYCENYCVYCGFNCYNHIHRKKLTEAEMEAEMKVIADSGIEEILMLTGESRAATDCKKGLPGRGIGWLKAVCNAVSIPVYAIGGISDENISLLSGCDIAGYCMMSESMRPASL